MSRLEGTRRPPAPMQTLERRHRDLIARYKALLERVAEDREAESAFHRLSWFALQRSSSAVAMFREGRVVLANRRWHALSSARDGAVGWTISDGKRERTYAALGTLGATELSRLSNKEAATTLRCHRRDGRQVLRLRLERMTPREEQAIGLLLVDDVTEETAREAEMATMREHMKKREQMAALGRLAAGVAHDLGNTLTAMALRMELVSRAAPEAARPHVHKINESVAVMRKTLDRLEVLGGRRTRPLKLIDLRAVIRSAIDVAGLPLQPAAGKAPRIYVALQLPRRLPRVIGDETEMTNVLVNLLVNARDAMKRGRITVIATSEKKRVVVRVCDEGPGFSPEHLDRLFEPFFTTKGARGSGIGLWLAYGYMDSVGGTIHAANRDGGGAELVLEFPPARAEA